MNPYWLCVRVFAVVAKHQLAWFIGTFGMLAEGSRGLSRGIRCIAGFGPGLQLPIRLPQLCCVRADANPANDGCDIADYVGRVALPSSGVAIGRQQRPQSSKLPTYSFFFLSTDITGWSVATNDVTCWLMCSNWGFRSRREPRHRFSALTCSLKPSPSSKLT